MGRVKAQAIGIALAVLVAIGVAYAGSNGVGTGGLQGFPADQNVSGSGSQIGPGCVTTATGIYCGTVDAGVLFVQGQAAANDLVLHATSAGGINFSDSNGANRITWGSGRYVSWHATGYLMPTGGADGLSAGSIGLGTTPKLADSATAPTVANGCTGEAVTWNNGSANFRFDVGTSCTGVTSTIITLPAVANCWTCSCFDIAADATLQQAFAGCATTTFTISNRTRATQAAADYTDSADIQCSCRGG